MNFSADALRKVIEGFYEHLLSDIYDPRSCEKLLIKKVKEVSIEQNVVFGSVFVIDILLKKSALEMHLDFDSYMKLMSAATMDSYTIGQGIQVKYPKRMLITPCCDISKTPEFV